MQDLQTGSENQSIETSSAPEVSSEVTDTSSSVSETQVAEHTEGEHQEQQSTLAANNPAKQRIDKRIAEQREKAELKQRVDMLERQLLSKNQPSFEEHQMAQAGGIVDPYTGQMVMPGSPRYEQVRFEQDKAAFQSRQSQEQQIREFEYHRQRQLEKFGMDIQAEMERDPEFETLVDDIGTKMSTHMRDVAMMIPNGTELIKYLGKNPKEVERIAKLHPFQQQAEVARHAYNLASKPKVSSAPPPIQKVGETAGGSSSGSIADMSIAQLKNLLR